MERTAHYNTVTEAIADLRSQGYTTDFNLEENCIVCNEHRFTADEFEITDVYRYEGDSDPADEAVVYGIRSNSGLKGILVAGYGTYSDTMTDAMLRKLRATKA